MEPAGARRRYYYELAGYANDVPGFEQDKEEVDQADGKLDGKWRDNDIEQLLAGLRHARPAPRTRSAWSRR